MKLESLIKSLPEDIDGVIIESPENRHFFTGFPSSAGILIAAKNKSVFLTDCRYIEAAKNLITCCEVQELKKREEQLPCFAKLFGCRRLACEVRWQTVAGFEKLARTLGDIELCRGEEADILIENLRLVKGEAEVAKIKTAQKIAEAAFENILNFIRPGVTEREIALELDFFMLKNGAESLAFETIVASGANSSKPHAVPSDKKVESGDFITMDFGATAEGYRSDMTRTVALTSVTEKQSLVYETVLAAQKAALEVLKPGLSCVEADVAAREVIEAAGYGGFFGHGLGHGVGIEIHEGPTLSPKGKGNLSPGNIVTVEPGIYLPGQFGVRIEDMALITLTGCENLTKAAKELIIL